MLHISIKTMSNKLKLVSIYVRFLILYEKMVAVDLHFQMECIELAAGNEHNFYLFNKLSILLFGSSTQFDDIAIEG